MALENTVAKYILQIVVDGTAQPAVQELNNIHAAAQNAATGTSTATAGLSELRNTSMAAREGMRGLNEALILSGGAAFPGLTRSVLLARDAMMLTRSAALLTGAGIGEIAGVATAVLIPAIATAVTGWQAYKAAVEEAASANRLVAQTGDNAVRNLDAVQAALERGLITADQAKKVIPFLNDQLSLGAGQQMMRDMGISGLQVDQYDKLKKLEDEMNRTTLDHFEQQRAKAKTVFDERMAQINKLAFSNGLTAKERGPAEAGAMSEYNSTLGGINDSQQSKAAAELTKQIDDDLFLYENNLGEKRKLSAQEEFDFRVEKFHQAAQSGEVSEDAFTNYIISEERKRVAASAATAKERETQQGQLGTLENKITLDNLTGEARKQEAIRQTTQAFIVQYTTLATALGISQAAQQKEIDLIKSGAQVQAAATEENKQGLTDIQQVEDKLAHEFASGLTSAIMDFAEGTKSAKQVFSEFAASFMMDIAKMIDEALILTLIQEALGMTQGKSFSELFVGNMKADGGVTFAASGLAGVASVSAPTYLPRFNTIAGEAGMEMLTVLARPTFRSIGGMDAIVGNAGSSRLAITNADDLAARGGAGGIIQIKVDMHPDLKAQIVSSSIKGAQVQIAQDMKRNTPISAAVKGLTA